MTIVSLECGMPQRDPQIDDQLEKEICLIP